MGARFVGLLLSLILGLGVRGVAANGLRAGASSSSLSRFRDYGTSQRSVKQGRRLLQAPDAREGPNGIDPQVLRLHWAIQRGNINRVKILLGAGVDPNSAATAAGTPPLWRAAIRNESKIVKTLIKFGADLNIANKNGTTALYVASQQGNSHIVRMLLEAGANVNMRSKWGSSALLVAASLEGNEDIVSALLDAGANPRVHTWNSKQSPVFVAAAQGHKAIVNVLLAAGDRTMKDVPDRKGTTPLQAAATVGRRGSVQTLLKFDVNLDRRRRDGSVALHGAAANCHVGIVNILVAAGSQRNVTNARGKQPIDIVCLNRPEDGSRRGIIENSLMPLLSAVQQNDAKLVEALIRRGEDANGHLENKTSLLMFAVKNGEHHVVDVLLRGGADPNKKDVNGNSALHMVATNGAADIATLLLAANAAVNAKNAENETALHIAARAGHVAIIEALKPQRPKPNLQDSESNTPLHFAVQDNNTQVTAALLGLGADPNITNGLGETPRSIAERNGFVDITSLIVELFGVREESAQLVEVVPEALSSREDKGAGIKPVNSSSGASSAVWIIPAVLIPVILFPALCIFLCVRNNRSAEKDFIPTEELAMDSTGLNPSSIGADSSSEWGSLPSGGGIQDEVMCGRVGEKRGSQKIRVEPLDLATTSSGSDNRRVSHGLLNGSEHNLDTDESFLLSAGKLISPRPGTEAGTSKFMTTASPLTFTASDQLSPHPLSGSSDYVGANTTEIVPPMDSGISLEGDSLSGHDVARSGATFHNVQQACEDAPSPDGTQSALCRGQSGAPSVSVASWLQSEQSEQSEQSDHNNSPDESVAESCGDGGTFTIPVNRTVILEGDEHKYGTATLPGRSNLFRNVLTPVGWAAFSPNGDLGLRVCQSPLSVQTDMQAPQQKSQGMDSTTSADQFLIHGVRGLGLVSTANLNGGQPEESNEHCSTGQEEGSRICPSIVVDGRQVLVPSLPLNLSDELDYSSESSVSTSSRDGFPSHPINVSNLIIQSSQSMSSLYSENNSQSQLVRPGSACTSEGSFHSALPSQPISLEDDSNASLSPASHLSSHPINPANRISSPPEGSDDASPTSKYALSCYQFCGSNQSRSSQGSSVSFSKGIGGGTSCAQDAKRDALEAYAVDVSDHLSCSFDSSLTSQKRQGQPCRAAVTEQSEGSPRQGVFRLVIFERSNERHHDQLASHPVQVSSELNCSKDISVSSPTGKSHDPFQNRNDNARGLHGLSSILASQTLNLGCEQQYSTDSTTSSPSAQSSGMALLLDQMVEMGGCEKEISSPGGPIPSINNRVMSNGKLNSRGTPIPLSSGCRSAGYRVEGTGNGSAWPSLAMPLEAPQMSALYNLSSGDRTLDQGEQITSHPVNVSSVLRSSTDASESSSP